MDLLLDIRQASNIEEALSQYFRQERIGGNAGDGDSNMYKCEKCKIKVQAKKRYLIERPPAVLCIQLKRFSLLGGKISKPVQLHRRINLAPYIQSKSTLSSNVPNANREHVSSPQGVSSVNCEYTLVAMITHVGPSPNCGHYTAIGEAANGQFFQFDDSSVRPISVGQALNTASYVVFYEMTKASWRNVTNAVCRVKESNSNHENGMPSPSPKVKLPCTITSQSNPGGSANPATAKPTLNLYNKPNGINTNNENKPRIISLGSSMKTTANKLGIVSGAAKSAMAAATTIIRTVTSVASGASSITSANSSKSTTNKGGLVPYDEDSSDSENTASAAKETEGQILKINSSSTKRPLTTSPFIPRSVTVNALKAKPSMVAASKVETINKETKSLQTSSQNILQAQSIERKNSSSGVWTVTDADTYNPSVNSDNSTGSTSGNWTVKDIDSSNSSKNHVTEEESMITVQHSKTASSWTVKPALSPSSLAQANVKMSESMSSDTTSASQKKFNSSMSDSESNNCNGALKSGPRITSPSPSNGSSTSSNSSNQYKSDKRDISIKTVAILGNDTPRKRCNGGNTDDADTDYDAELDRGRTKKVKKTDSGNGMHTLPSYSSSNHNPFQVAQNNHNTKTENRKSDVPNNKMINGNRSPWQTPRNKSWGHRDHNYQRQRQGADASERNNHREERRNSFGANDYKDRKFRNGGYNNESYRGNSTNSNSYNNRDYEYPNNHRDYRDNRSYFLKR
jgi:ubiquitin carboxyl-terminal hydrolase 36/42